MKCGSNSRLPHSEAQEVFADCLVPRELDGPLFDAAKSAREKFRAAHEKPLFGSELRADSGDLARVPR